MSNTATVLETAESDLNAWFNRRFIEWCRCPGPSRRRGQ